MTIKISALDTNIDNKKETKIVALCNDELIGIVGVDCTKRSACILNLYVNPEFRKQGIGTKLVEECCFTVKEAGCETIALLLAKDNSNETFYIKLGFMFAYQYDDNDILMLRKL